MIAPKKRKDNPISQSISKIQWDTICAIQENLPGFSGLIDHIYENPGIWSFYVSSNDFLKQKVPGNWGNALNPFTRLIFIRIFRPEKTMLSLFEYVKETMGQLYAESPPSTLDKLYEDSDRRTPIIFVLSQGADPTESLVKLAEEQGFSEKTAIISLGQGQGPRAEEALEKAKSSGH